MANKVFDNTVERSGLQPIFIVEVTFPTSGVKYFSLDGIRSGSQFYEARLLNAGTIQRALHRHASLFETGTISLKLSNVDLEMSKIMFTDIIQEAPVTVKAGTPDMDFGEFKSIASGVITDYSMRDMMLNIVVKDSFVELPEFPVTGKVNTTDSGSIGYFPDAYEGHVGKVLPVIYGTHSVNGIPTDYRDRGKVPAILIDTTTDAQRFLVACHALKSIDEVYVYTPEFGNVAKTLTTHYTVHKAATLNGQTMAYIQVAASMFSSQFLDTTGNLGIVSVNVTGAEDVGDGTGTLYDEPVEVLKEFLADYCGNPTIDSTSFDAVENICQERGYVCAGGYTEEKTTQEVLSEFLKCFDIKLYVKGDGSLALSILSPQTILDVNAPEFKEGLDIIDWDLQFYSDYEGGQQDQVINTIAFDFDYHLARQVYQGGGESNNSDSVTDYGEQKVTIQMPWTSTENTAEDASTRIINRFATPNAVAHFRTSLKGLRVELGEVVKLTHMEFPSVDGGGIADRYFQVSEINADLDGLTVDVVANDVQDILSNGFILGDETTLAGTWLTAKGTADALFGYLCDDTTGEFSDGTAGKQLL